MSIVPTRFYAPAPAAVRAQAVHLSYDAKNDRICYANGKLVIVRAVDPSSSATAIQFTKHTHTTTVAAFAPSGNYVASGDEAGNVKIWDSAPRNGGPGENSPFETPIVKSEFQILAGPIKAISWDADGTRIIAVGLGKDKFGHCFTWDSGNSIGEIQGHADTITDVAIRPVRPYRAATVSEDKALVFYNGPPFKFDKSVRGLHTNAIRTVSFSPDGLWLISAGSDRKIAIYDGKTGEHSHTIEDAHSGGIFAISWYKDSSTFVSASADNSVKVWDAGSWKNSHTYTVSETTAVENQQVGVVVTNEYVVSLSLNGNLNYFTTGSSLPKHVVPGHQLALTAVQFLNNTLITGGADGKALKWAYKTPDFTSVPAEIGDASSRHGNYVVSVAESGKNTLTAGWDDHLRVWEDTLVVSKIALVAQPKQVVVSGDHIVVLFESLVEIYSPSFKKTAEEKLTYDATSVGVAPGKLFIANSTQRRVEEYQLTASSISHTKSLPETRAPPTLIRVSPDGEYLAAADSTGKYTLYKTADGLVVTTRWAFHSSKVLDAQWTSDSKFVLSGGLDSGLFLYSVERPSKVLKFPLAHQNGVTGVAWTEYDGEKKQASFVTTGQDGYVKTWKVDLSVY